jgi:hypothetical protein
MVLLTLLSDALNPWNNSLSSSLSAHSTNLSGVNPPYNGEPGVRRISGPQLAPHGFPWRHSEQCDPKRAMGTLKGKPILNLRSANPQPSGACLQGVAEVLGRGREVLWLFVDQGVERLQAVVEWRRERDLNPRYP